MATDLDLEASGHDDAPVTTSKKNHPDGALLAEAVTINRSAEELFAFWRDPTNLVGVLDNVNAIEPIDANRSRWTVKAPAGREVGWESIITNEVPNQEISWQSAPGADVSNSGRIEFREVAGRGTVVRAVMSYDPPAGVVGQLIAKLFQREPRIQTRRDLRRFKQLMETGEIATSARTLAQLQKEDG
ncbi:cyclase/dehydrase [Novosphingobium sp. Rr 2-17]|uniref:SRPBCC family protein n=1 Tax=Novosphingobium sp. Rr 2-17 TaxID=555793 RepID=UPI000269950B|nr:SRPBCC family protein [Novosphingobium sp. Rr 2-17]EIZ79864.1 cyclase/dehydrase [Novosphingobium sp. Rr 2-17]